MKRKAQGGVIVITLAILLYLGILAGGGIVDYVSGAVTMTDDMSIAQAEGTYVSYSITYPVASYPEEYYSGNTSRVKNMAYIIYDEQRQTFVKVVVSHRDTNGLDRLLRAVNMSDGTKEAWGDQLEKELRPVALEGTFAPVGSADAVEAIIDVLESDAFEASEEIRAMACAQSDWYVLENGYIRGIDTGNIKFCLVIMGINIVLLLIALIALLKKGPDKDSLSESIGGASARFFLGQLSWLESWCRDVGASRMQTAGLGMVLIPAALTALGFWVGYDLTYVLTCHLVVGLGIGEMIAVSMLFGVRMTCDAYKLLQKYDKSFQKLYPDQLERERVAQNLLEADNTWRVQELTREECIGAVLGDRFWMVLKGTKNVHVVDVNRIGKMYSETVSGQVRSGKVHYHYTNYVVYFFYQGDEGKKHPNVELVFHTEDASGQFMTLARKRLGDRAGAIIG